MKDIDTRGVVGSTPKLDSDGRNPLSSCESSSRASEHKRVSIARRSAASILSGQYQSILLALLLRGVAGLLLIISLCSATKAQESYPEIDIMKYFQESTRSWTTTRCAPYVGTDGAIVMNNNVLLCISRIDFANATFCASEFEVTADIDMGTRLDGGYGQWLSAGTKDGGISVGMRVNGNSAVNPAVWPAPESLQFGQTGSAFLPEYIDPRIPNRFSAAVPMTFPVKGSGWVAASLRASATKITATLTKNGTVTVYEEPRLVAFGSQPIAITVVSDTGAWGNVHRIRNLRVKIIKSSICSGATAKPTLSANDAVTAAAQQCGSFVDCPADIDARLSCTTGLFDRWKQEGVVTAVAYDAALAAVSDTYSQCSATLCDAKIAAATKSAYTTGYAAGVASVDVQAIKTTAYASGFQSGVASVDVSALKKVAFDEGYAAGKESVVCSAPDRGNEKDDGGSGLPGSGDTLDPEEAGDLLSDECSCLTARNKGQYVSCVARFLSQLQREGLIPNETRKLMQRSAVKQCGKKPKASAEKK